MSDTLKNGLKFLCAAFLALLAAIMLMPSAAHAAPAYEGEGTLTQADGTRFSAYLHGDEAFHYYTDAEGNLIYKDGETWRSRRAAL